jgi:glucosamine--fructose-6-phosphate aminotransferase (isomerizing)
MSHLRDEIFEQPQVFDRLLTDSLEQVRAVARAVAARPPELVVFAARGSSDNAVTYARYLIETHLGLPVSSAAPSIYSHYNRFPNLSDALVIGISQSGQSPDVVGVLAEAQRQGALTVAVTNERSSPLARAADLLIEQCAGQELSVAATKTYTTQLLALALLVAELNQDDQLLAGIHRLPAATRLALQLEDAAEQMAEDLAHDPACLVLARGFNYATAFELALKFKELAYIFAEPYSAADFMHGPIALAQRGLPAILIGVRGPSQEGMLELADQLVDAGVGVFPISDDPSLLAKATSTHSLSLVAALAGVPESLSPIVSVIPGQLLAMHLAARRRGGNLDQPRRLAKVTRTQ